MEEEIRPFPSIPAYEVSNLGRVRRRGGQWLSLCVAKRGSYLICALWNGNKGHTMPIHRIVAFTFLPPPLPGQTDVAHNDGDKTNNRADNLRWATRAENEADKVRHGRSNQGERNGMSKLTNEQAARIREQGRNGPHGIQVRLAREYGICTSAVWNIINGRRWSGAR